MVDRFSNNTEVFHALRATCHVPLVGGVGPYCYDGHAYYDGFFWSSSLVPWKGFPDDHVVKVSAFKAPRSAVKPPLLPPWWSLFPPDVSILRGMYWLGYQDMARWFAHKPTSLFDSCACRRAPTRTASPRAAAPPDESDAADTDDPLLQDGSEAWAAARALLLRTPSASLVPDRDGASGESPHELINACLALADRDWKIFTALAVAVVAVWLGLATACPSLAVSQP